MTAPARVDLLVVGGGVNGTGIARDAAGRGLSVLLCEQDDLAAHTSSASTKLIHGGLRYLEEFHFALVRKALQEREVLLAAAPHIMRPLQFVMPHAAHLRPAWMIRAGLFLYDHLAARARLAGSSSIDLRTHIAGAPLQAGYRRGFVYSDGWVDDARLVVLNALDAQQRGATILTRTRCERLTAQPPGWSATLADAGGQFTLQARAVVNAAGPWVSRFVADATPVRARYHVRLVKGSHIVVPRLFAHDYAYIFQNDDRRIVFAIPYEHDFTLLGTTDVDYAGDLRQVAIDPDEVSYLCTLANRYFRRQIAAHEVVWSYSGVRPLLADEARDPMRVTRDYALELDTDPAPLLSVFGGKITTYRRLAEDALDAAGRHARGARRCLDRARLPARRGSAAGQLRGVPAHARAALPVAAAGAADALCARVRHAHRADARRGRQYARARHAAAAAAVRARGGVPVPRGVRAHAPRTSCGAAPSSDCTCRTRT